MQKVDNQTVLFLFGRQPGEGAMLEAQVLVPPLQRLGWQVQLAGPSGQVAQVLRGRLGLPVQEVAFGLRRVPILGRLLGRPLPVLPAVVHAWDLEAAAVARSVAGPGVPVYLTAGDRLVPCHPSSKAASRPPQSIVQKALAIAPAVDSDLLASHVSSRRSAVRAALGIDPQTGPILASPPPVQRSSRHFEAAWGMFILRRGGVPAQLLLPQPGRESRRILRFGKSCHEQAGVVSCPAGTSWLDLLAAADVVIIPDEARIDPVLAAWAMGSGRPVVVFAGSAESHNSSEMPAGVPLSAETCTFTEDARPLSLARALLRVWQDRDTSAVRTQAAGEQVRRQCDPAQVAGAYAEVYRSLDGRRRR